MMGSKAPEPNDTPPADGVSSPAPPPPFTQRTMDAIGAQVEARLLRKAEENRRAHAQRLLVREKDLEDLLIGKIQICGLPLDFRVERVFVSAENFECVEIVATSMTYPPVVDGDQAPKQLPNYRQTLFYDRRVYSILQLFHRRASGMLRNISQIEERKLIKEIASEIFDQEVDFEVKT